MEASSDIAMANCIAAADAAFTPNPTTKVAKANTIIRRIPDLMLHMYRSCAISSSRFAFRHPTVHGHWVRWGNPAAVSEPHDWKPNFRPVGRERVLFGKLNS